MIAGYRKVVKVRKEVEMLDHRHMLYEYDYKSRHNELLREAEIVRMLKPARNLDNSQNHLFVRVLSSMGHQLVSLGQRLERVGDNPGTVLAFENSACRE